MTGSELTIKQEDLTTVKRESFGTVAFANDVIATLAGLAAVDIPGVAGMSGGFVDGLAELLGRKNLSKGIKVELGEEEVTVDAAIIAEYGKSIPDIAGMIQQKVGQAIESMTGLKVKAVNVRVQGLWIEPQLQEAREPQLARVK